METNYLYWFKDLYQDICHRDDIFSLLSSNVSEPTAVLQELIEAGRGRLAELMATSNEWGHPALLKAIAQRQGLAPENITPANGASNAITLVCQALLKKGDRVVIEHPVYQPLELVPNSMGAEVIRLERRSPDFGIDQDRLASLIDKNTKLIILTNLHNPSTSYLQKEELLQIAGIAKKASPGIRILIDEIYGDLVPEGFTYAAALDDCFATISSLSKVYGLSLLRCGWIAADIKTSVRIRKQWAMTEGCGSRILDSISVVVFENIDRFLKRSLRMSEANRKIALEILTPLIDQGILSGPIPRYGCIYFPRIKKAEKLAVTLREKHKIYVVPGSFFGAPEHIRIGFGGEAAIVSRNLGKFADILRSEDKIIK